MSIIQMDPLNSDAGRIAVLNEGTGAKIIASNQCGEFPFVLKKATDPRTDIDAIADYDKTVVAYVGARNWNKQTYDNEHASNSQLKWSNIKTSGAGYLIDMRWWINYKVKITFTNFPYCSKDNSKPMDDEDLFADENIMCLKAYPLHQCTDNIHLRINNRDMICYPTQMLNQRMEYWNQDKLKESCGFCPHRKPCCQTTYEFSNLGNVGRSQFMNLGATYDGDFGNEVVLDKINVNLVGTSSKYTVATTKYKPWTLVNGTITFSMREPVMAEPLDYYSSRGATKTMNNVTSIDLEYNFNNLRNMILFNRGKMYDMSLLNPPVEDTDGYTTTNHDWWVDWVEKKLDDIMTVEITEAELEMDVATPHIPPSMPFVTDYVEYRRYETKANKAVELKDELLNNSVEEVYSITSDIYSLSYMPNSIYLWVAPDSAKTYSSNYRCFYNNSYAQITHVEVDYGNLSKLGHNYKEKDLFLMALRNGLEDRQYVDWTRTKKTFYQKSKTRAKNDAENVSVANLVSNEFYGVGSVLRIIPGLDLCSGGEQTLIGGMKITNETIKFEVQYRPLNMFDPDITYSLFVAFEYNGICTITPGFCDLAMIHIDSYNQIANAERAPRYKISRIYGKGLTDLVGQAAKGINNFAKKSKIISKTIGMIPSAVKKMGYGYPGTVTRMRGGMVIPPGSFYRTY